MAIVISFDLDGTVEGGDPPGPVTMEMVKRAKEHGFIIGSCSDRSLREQQEIWDKGDVKVDFISLKHLLSQVKARFPAEAYYHVGDRDVDWQTARGAGVKFLSMDFAAGEPWLTGKMNDYEYPVRGLDSVHSGQVERLIQTTGTVNFAHQDDD